MSLTISVSSSESNEAAIRRLAGALLLEQNDEYAIQKRYMSLGSLAAMSENPPIRLPVAPALACK
jgi:putative transposase